ncbi:MAG: hypothetical protein HOW97_36295 [Catenulispora sp.]|nr:hypothetical protein [Catenulispora sp.]
MSNDSPASGATARLAPPRDGLPRPGSYRAAGGGPILEIAARLGPLTTLRGRFAALEDSLVVEDAGDRAALLLEASAPSLRTTRPLAGRRLLGRRGLDARNHGLVRLQTDQIRLLDHAQWQFPAQLTLRGTQVDITMTARVAARTADRIALIANGEISSSALRRRCSARLPRSVPATRIRFTLAADFR